MLRAKEGRIIKTVPNRSLIKVSSNLVSGVSGPEAVITIHIPIIPKSIDEYIKIFVAIFCIELLYHLIILKLTYYF